MKTAAAFLAVVAVLIGLGPVACAGAPAPKKPPPPPPACNTTPQWTFKNQKGADVGIFICFGADGHLLYATKDLPSAPVKAAAAPLKKDEKEFIARGKKAVRKIERLGDAAQ